MKSIKLMVLIMVAGMVSITSCSESDQYAGAEKNNNLAVVKTIPNQEVQRVESDYESIPLSFEVDQVTHDSIAVFDSKYVKDNFPKVSPSEPLYTDIINLVNNVGCETCKTRHCVAYQKIKPGGYAVKCDDGNFYYAEYSSGSWHLSSGYWTNDGPGGQGVYHIFPPRR